MAIKAVTKAKRLARKEKELDAYDEVTSNLEARLKARKSGRDVIVHDIKVLKLTRTADGEGTDATADE